MVVNWVVEYALYSKNCKKSTLNDFFVLIDVCFSCKKFNFDHRKISSDAQGNGVQSQNVLALGGLQHILNTPGWLKDPQDELFPQGGQPLNINIYNFQVYVVFKPIGDTRVAPFQPTRLQKP